MPGINNSSCFKKKLYRFIYGRGNVEWGNYLAGIRFTLVLQFIRVAKISGFVKFLLFFLHLFVCHYSTA